MKQFDSPEEAYIERYEMPAPVDRPPKRVVSLVPSLTESLFDLNLGERLVGVTNYCIYPREGVASLPKVGGTKNPNIDTIIALDPDLVIFNQEENRKEDADALQAADIPIWVTHPQTVQEALNLLWEILSIFDEPSSEVGERVRWLERQVDWTAGAAAIVETEGATPSVFVPIWVDPWMTFTEQTYIHDVLRICGGRNVFASLGKGERGERYPHITLDEVVEAQPEIVLLPDEPYKFTHEHADQIAQLDIPAAHEGRIHLVEGSLLTWHGTRLAYTLRDIPPLLSSKKRG